MVLQLHPQFHLAESTDSLQTSRRLRLVRRLVLDPLGLDPPFRSRNQATHSRRVRSGIQRSNVETRELSDQERCVAPQSLGPSAATRASPTILQTGRKVGGSRKVTGDEHTRHGIAHRLYILFPVGLPI